MNDKKSHFNKKGMYNGYDKNHKERDALDYYATPPEEVYNILNTINFDFSTNDTILEPSAGGGHMLIGINKYCQEKNVTPNILATDISLKINSLPQIETGIKFDFLSDDYPYSQNIDYIIMNPPYSIIEPFIMKSLGIANKGVLMLGRLQFLEGEKRYNNILKDCPPTDVYVYINRIACFKNGNMTEKISSAQAYAWFYWDFNKTTLDFPKIHFLHRFDKQ